MSEKHTIEITTAFAHGLIEQTELLRMGPNVSSEISRRVINLREQGVRDALIALGWTPPVDPMDQAG